MLLGILLSALLGVDLPGSEALACDFKPIFTQQKYDDGLVLVAETFTETFIWDAPATQNSVLEEFQSFVAARTYVDPLDLLKRQSQIFHDMNLGYEAQRIDAVIAGKLGSITELGCVEGSLFTQHKTGRRPESETEFAAYVFEKQSIKGTHLKIYHVDSDGASVSFPKRLDEELLANMLSGWTFLVHLHNHPFLLDSDSGDIAGTTVPSDPDMITYGVMADLYGLQNAWITNGFNTIKIHKNQFKDQ
jgi:hypothetical protein